MVGKRGSLKELDPPPLASADAAAEEVLRVWTSPTRPYQLTLHTHWDDPGAWGILLVDVAKHAAQAYARKESIRAPRSGGSWSYSKRSYRGRRLPPRTSPASRATRPIELSAARRPAVGSQSPPNTTAATSIGPGGVAQGTESRRVTGGDRRAPPVAVALSGRRVTARSTSSRAWRPSS